MAKPTTTFLDETIAAARGCVALLIGNRQAAGWFDFSQRGLIGSLIAVLVGILIAAYGPLLIGVQMPPGAATQSVMINLALFAGQAVTAFLALRQMGRQDGFVPYLVASNWVTLASSLLLLLSILFGPIGIALLVLVLFLALASFINIGRFIVTLTGLQIGLLFLSQAVGVFLVATIAAVMFGAPVPAA